MSIVRVQKHISPQLLAWAFSIFAGLIAAAYARILFRHSESTFLILMSADAFVSARLGTAMATRRGNNPYMVYTAIATGCIFGEISWIGLLVRDWISPPNNIFGFSPSSFPWDYVIYLLASPAVALHIAVFAAPVITVGMVAFNLLIYVLRKAGFASVPPFGI